MKIKALIKKGLLFGLAVVFVSVVISLVVGEFIVKHTMPQETYGLARMVGLHFFEASPIIPFTLKKNVKDFLHIGFTREFNHKVSTNSWGIRGKEFSKDKEEGTYRILFLGDSMTFGWGVEDNQPYPALIEKYLNSPAPPIGNYKKVETINAAFTDGFTVDDYYLYYKEIASKFKPDLVIVNLFPYNDISDLMERSWEKVDSRGYPEKIVSTTHYAKDGYLISKKKTNWKLEVPILRRYHLGILFMNALEKGAPGVVAQIKKALNIYEGKEPVSVEERLSCIYSMQETNCSSLLWPNFDKAKFILRGFKELARANNQELLVTIMASPDEAVPLSEKADREKLLETIQPQKYFKDFFKEEQINTLDLLPTLSESKAQRFFYKQDGHLGREGHDQVAKEIVRYLRKAKPSIFPS
jgi:lysophospholipase L1-like esterase